MTREDFARAEEGGIVEGVGIGKEAERMEDNDARYANAVDLWITGRGGVG